MPYIRPIYPVDISIPFRGSFDDAFAFWNSVITSGTAGYTFPSSFNAEQVCGVSHTFKQGDVITGLDIITTMEKMDGEGGLIATSGPCSLIGGLPVLAVSKYDLADSRVLLDAGNFGDLVRHEIAHALGFGSLNQRFVRGNAFTGSRAMAAYQRLGGAGALALEDDTLAKHWNEKEFFNELMTGYLNVGTTNPVSILTISALSDIGYGVDERQAEEFHLASEFMRPVSTELLQLKGDVLNFDLKDLDEEVKLFGIKEGIKTRISNNGEEIDIESPYKNQMTGLFAVMFLGFLMLGALLMSFSRQQNKALKKLMSGSVTENPNTLPTRD